MEQDIKIQQAVSEAIERKEKELCLEIMVLGCIASVMYLLFDIEITFFSFMEIVVAFIAMKTVLVIPGKVRELKETRTAEKGTTA